TGYSIGTVTGCNGNLSGNTFTTGQITSACVVSASFAASNTTYTITASAGTGGSISPSGAVAVKSGLASPTFIIAAGTGYQVSSVLLDGSPAGAITSYTFSNVTANHTISATFVSSGTVTITPTAGTNGAISPATPVKVNSGG